MSSSSAPGSAACQPRSGWPIAGLSVEVVDMADGPRRQDAYAGVVAGPVDIGPTVMTMRTCSRICSEVGERLEDHVTLHADTVLARHWWRDGGTLDLHADPDLSAMAVRDFAGRQGGGGVPRFSDKARRLFEAFDAPVMQEPAPKLAP
jgi:1-hydroxycarotenoid 3,4-desaturase